MMMCVSTVTYNLNFNGKEIAPITPYRGLRRDDLLSPYLFILYAGNVCVVLISGDE